MNRLDDRPMIEVRLVFADGTQASRFWTWRDVQARKPPVPDQPAWMREPRRSWQHPQDPIIYSALVEEGAEDEARTWLEMLGGAA